MRAVNREKGVAFWCVDALDVLRVAPLIVAGAWVVEGEPGEFFVTDEVE